MDASCGAEDSRGMDGAACTLAAKSKGHEVIVAQVVTGLDCKLDLGHAPSSSLSKNSKSQNLQHYLVRKAGESLQSANTSQC